MHFICHVTSMCHKFLTSSSLTDPMLKYYICPVLRNFIEEVTVCSHRISFVLTHSNTNCKLSSFYISKISESQLYWIRTMCLNCCTKTFTIICIQSSACKLWDYYVILCISTQSLVEWETLRQYV